MPFLLLLLLTLACLPEPQDRSQPPAWLGVGGSVLVTWSGVAALAVAAIPTSGSPFCSVMLPGVCTT
jgi:hypothetical protein